MLAWSAWVLFAAALGGMALIVASQVAAGWARIRWPGMLHGAAGIAGFVLLVGGLAGPARGVQHGAGSFGVTAAGFIAAAVLLGLAVFAARVRRRPPSMLALGVHATCAVGGLVMLAAYLSA